MTIESEARKKTVIFYVDDDQDDLDTFTDALTDLEHTELYTMDRSDKLIAALHNPPPAPHILFLDLNMPGQNGFEILSELRQQERFRDLPIIMLSTSRDRQAIEKCRALGANYYIPKPNDFRSLKSSLQQVLDTDWANFHPEESAFVYKFSA